MQRKYTLEWLDFVVIVTLNPTKTDVTTITENQSSSIITMAGQEKDKIQSELKVQIYALQNQPEIELLVRRYHSDLVILLDQAHANQVAIGPCEKHLDRVFKITIDHLKEIISFIEVRYGKFLGLDERVPYTYVHLCREEIRNQLENLKTKLFRRISDKTLTGIVFDTLQDFVQGDRCPATLREVLYKKDLVKGLEEISLLKTEPQLYKALNELLIYRNFNKKKYLNYYTGKIAGKINSFAAAKDKLDQLLLSYKEFNQMHKKPGVRLNAHCADIKKVIGNWFAYEISYLQTKYQWDVNPLEQSSLPSAPASNKTIKTSINMTVDQIGLIIKALFDIGILISKSLSQVFKLITPLLSSSHQQEISWDSMRRKSYTLEQRDKEAVITMLENMIAHIKENY